MNAIEKVGSYASLMYRAFTKPDSWSMFFRRYLEELKKQGWESLGITLLISVFIGAVITIQMINNLENPIFPNTMVGLATRDTLLLEFSSSILCLILAGKVGSNIASELGTMRITEQIDALDIMGVNSANYLILPKIVAFVTISPFLVLTSMFVGLIGGYSVGVFTDMITVNAYISGIQYAFTPYYIPYSVIKSLVFAFVIASVSSYYGYTVKGGALEVGKASTNAVVNSYIMILFLDLILSKLLL